MNVQRIKKCEWCGHDIIRVKSNEKRISWKQWKRTRFCSQPCKIKGTQGENWAKKKTLFKKGQALWNKGKRKKNPIIPRKIPERYLAELMENAERARRLGYHNTKHRREQIRERAREVIEACGIHGRQDWQGNELDFLKENFRKMNLWEIALKLNRSYSSVTHKANRLGLIQYNKWNIPTLPPSNSAVS